MTVTESRFGKLESRVNEIEQKIARLEGASSAPQKSPTSLITILSLLGMAIVGYWGWIGIQVVDQGKKIEGIVIQLNPGKALQDISKLDEKRFAKALPAL